MEWLPCTYQLVERPRSTQSEKAIPGKDKIERASKISNFFLICLFSLQDGGRLLHFGKNRGRRPEQLYLTKKKSKSK
jgi:hypothetical protein